MDYVELHARSTFSFLRAGSSPEQLIQAAAHLEVPRMALCDRDGFYGSVRHHMTAKENGIRALVGAELTMEDDTVVPLLVATREGYRGLSRLITTAKLRAPKGESRVTWSELAEASAGLFALTGDEEGPVLSGWRRHGPAGAAAGCARLARIFGHDRLFVEIQRHHRRGEDRTVRALRDLAEARGLPLLATNGVSYATPGYREVLDAFTCIRHHTHLDAAGRLLTIYKNIDHAASDQLIATNTYNELGQLQNKELGDNLENLAYTYNIRGWLSTINKDYVSGSSNSNYFGMELGYDKTTAANTNTSYASRL